MRLAEQHEDHGVGMALADFGDLGGGMAVAGADLAQIFARHAVQAVDRFGMIARGDQQFVKWGPVVSPIEVEADALAEFALVDFAAPPFVENVLVASENGFDSEHHGAIPSQRPLLNQRCGVALRGGQRVVVADQDDIGGAQSFLHLLGIEQRIVAAKCLVEFAKIFSAVVRILGADFALHSRQRVQLRCAAAGSEIGGRWPYSASSF